MIFPSRKFPPAVAPGFLIIALLITSCGKQTPGNGNGNGNGTGTDTSTNSSCPLIREISSQPDGLAERWDIIPDHNNHIREVDGLNQYGTTTFTATIGPLGIRSQFNGILVAYNFNDSIFTGKPSAYTYTSSNGLKTSAALQYDGDGLISQIDQFDGGGLPSSTVNLRYKDGNLMQAIYQSQSGTRELSTYQAIGYDDHPNPYADMAGSRYLFYNWEYFTVADIQMDRVYQHCSKNNCLGYYQMYNGIKFIDQTFTYVYDDRGYPTSVDQHYIFRSTVDGSTIKDEHYQMTYTYNNCD